MFRLDRSSGPRSPVVHSRTWRVKLHRVDPLLHRAFRRVRLAGENDLAVTGLEIEHETVGSRLEHKLGSRGTLPQLIGTSGFD